MPRQIAVDAAMLARFAALLEPPVRPVVSADLDDMKELHVARRALVKDRIAALNRETTAAFPLLRRQASQSVYARSTRQTQPPSTPHWKPCATPIRTSRPASTSS